MSLSGTSQPAPETADFPAADAFKLFTGKSIGMDKKGSLEGFGALKKLRDSWREKVKGFPLQFSGHIKSGDVGEAERLLAEYKSWAGATLNEGDLAAEAKGAIQEAGGVLEREMPQAGDIGKIDSKENPIAVCTDGTYKGYHVMLCCLINSF